MSRDLLSASGISQIPQVQEGREEQDWGWEIAATMLLISKSLQPQQQPHLQTPTISSTLHCAVPCRKFPWSRKCFRHLPTIHCCPPGPAVPCGAMHSPGTADFLGWAYPRTWSSLAWKSQSVAVGKVWMYCCFWKSFMPLLHIVCTYWT